MLFKELATYFRNIESTSSRLVITEILADLFTRLTPDELEKTVYLLQGRVAPAFEKIEFGMAEKTVIKAILSALNMDLAMFMNRYHILGDVGKTVEFFKQEIISFDQADHSVLHVYNRLHLLASTSGVGSNEQKISILAELISQLDGLSCNYLSRIPQGVLRLGFSDMTILDAYSWMIKKDKSLRNDLEHAYLVRPDLGYIGKILKEKGMEEVAKIEPVVGTPIIMMKAERLSSGKEIIEQIGNCAIEPKYDGFRLQIHLIKNQNPKSKAPNKPNIKLFSRSLEEVSAMYPDIIQAVEEEIDCQECILEGEAIGFDPKTQALLPFQDTVQRKRKYHIGEKAKEIPLKLFVFELLYRDGVSYIHKPFSERREVLEKIIIKKSNNRSILAPETVTDSPILTEQLFDKAIAEGLEGIIAKKLSGIYQPGARAWNWIKFKRSYSVKVQDTIDCLVMGYDFGKGKRTSFGIGAFLVGVYDKTNDTFLTIAKIGTGLTDEEWIGIQQKSERYKVAQKPNNYQVEKSMDCDVWIEPKIIVEIRADEITKSPIHTAQLALRFPRLERFRDDKKPVDCTQWDELKKMAKV